MKVGKNRFGCQKKELFQITLESVCTCISVDARDLFHFCLADTFSVTSPVRTIPAPFFVFEMGRQLLPCLLTCHVYLLFWVLFTYLCRWKEMRKDWATTRWGPVLSLWTTTAGCITWLVPWTKAKNKMILAWQYIRLDQDQVKIPEHAHWWKSGIKIPIKLRENTCGSYFGSVFTLMVAHNLALFMTVLLIRTKRFMDFAAPTHSFAQCEYRYLTRHKLTQMCKMLLRLMGMRPHFHIGVCVCVGRTPDLSQEKLR